MKILKLRASFGKLHGELELREGLNLLCLPNEAGKSTWSAFLLAMLYGIDTAERATKSNDGLPAKERYKPWDGSAMEGAMELEWQGRRITIERTSTARVPMGNFRAYESDSGTPVAELTADNCGRKLCGVERSVFERTAFIRQLGLTVTEDQALEKRLRALVTTGEDGGKTYSELDSTLHAMKNRLSGRAGRVPRLTQRQETLNRQLSEIRTLQDDIMRLTAELDAAEAEKTRLEALHARVQQAQAAQKRAGLNELAEKCAAQEQRCLLLEQTVAALPEESTLQALRQRLEAAESALQTAKMEAAFAPTPAEAPAAPRYFQDMDGAAAKQKVADDVAEFERLNAAKAPKKTLPLLLCALLLAAGAGLCAVSLPVGLAVAAVGLAALAVTLPILNKRAREAEAQHHRAALIPARYGVSSAAELPALAERYAAQLAAHAQKQTEAAALKQSLAERVFAAQGALDAVLAQVAEFAPECRTCADCREAIAAARSARDRLLTERRALESLRLQHASMQQLFGDAPAAQPDEEALRHDPARLAYDLQTARTRHELCATRLAEARGALSAKGDAVALEAELEQTQAALAADAETLDVIELALRALASADETLRSRFSPQITAEAGALLSDLTGGKYPSVLLEPNMRLSVRESEGLVMRPAAAMSCGTADQMYLALRLAMCRRLLPEDAPLLLDDALVNFDAERTASALALLRREAENRQVLLFTCRELE